MEKYLTSSEFIDWRNPVVLEQAKQLSSGLYNDVDISRKCFEFVRDEIRHSHDFSVKIVTAKASEVLEHKTGYCYAKSHLLAALLRANDIPAALSYQRLSIVGDGAPFCLHGLNSIHLKNFGWYRVDARGNKPGVDAQFDPPNEQLAFPLKWDGEYTLEGFYHEPLTEVIEVLKKYDDESEVFENLPDVKSPPR